MNSFRPFPDPGQDMRCKVGFEPVRGGEIEAAIAAADATGGRAPSQRVNKEGGETFGSRPLLVRLAN